MEHRDGGAPDGPLCDLRHAAEHWRERSKAGERVKAAVVNTASASGTFAPNPGQANCGAAKAGIAALTLVAAAELGRYGVRVNAIALARTRMSVDVPVVGELVKAPGDERAFDTFAPRHSSPLVAYLASERCGLTGKLFTVHGGLICECSGWTVGAELTTRGEWTIERLEAALDGVSEAA